MTVEIGRVSWGFLGRTELLGSVADFLFVVNTQPTEWEQGDSVCLYAWNRSSKEETGVRTTSMQLRWSAVTEKWRLYLWFTVRADCLTVDNISFVSARTVVTWMETVSGRDIIEGEGILHVSSPTEAICWFDQVLLGNKLKDRTSEVEHTLAVTKWASESPVGNAAQKSKKQEQASVRVHVGTTFS